MKRSKDERLKLLREENASLKRQWTRERDAQAREIERLRAALDAARVALRALAWADDAATPTPCDAQEGEKR